MIVFRRAVTTFFEFHRHDKHHCIAVLLNFRNTYNVALV